MSREPADSDAGGRGPADPAARDLALRDFRPRQRLRVPETPIAVPSTAAIDAHNHIGPTPFSGRWAAAGAADLEAVLDGSAIAAIVDLDGGQGDRLRRELARWAPLGWSRRRLRRPRLPDVGGSARLR